MKKLKKLTKKEHGELAAKVDVEGFGYYMMHYGPDMDAIERLGFDIEEIDKALLLLQILEEKIMEGEQYWGEE